MNLEDYEKKIKLMQAAAEFINQKNDIITALARRQNIINDTLSDSQVRTAETMQKIKLIEKGEFNDMLKKERPKPPLYENPFHANRPPNKAEEKDEGLKELYKTMETVRSIQDKMGNNLKNLWDDYEEVSRTIFKMQNELYDKLPDSEKE